MTSESLNDCVAETHKSKHISSDETHKLSDTLIERINALNGTRVLSQRGVNKALSVAEGGSQDRAQKNPRFLAYKPLQPFISADLTARISESIKYLPLMVEILLLAFLPASCRKYAMYG
jgi:hypothetical protein